ncbi:MAG: response regulator [Methyloprofundus sp.]|nr:response regulator [Methyloprofundus sp.]
MSKEVVYVEDNPVLRGNYTDLLIKEGFKVRAYETRMEAMIGFSEKLPDIAILDLELNGERDAGFQLCMYLRQKSPMLPILFLTSFGDEVDKISGFRLGADDYLTKTVSQEFLIIRINALLQRYDNLRNKSLDIDENIVGKQIANQLFIDKDRLLVYWNNQLIDLTLTQFWIVQELYIEPRKVKSPHQLMKAAKIHVEPNTITAHIKMIRQRFKLVDDSFNCIKTERGAGYRWLDS